MLKNETEFRSLIILWDSDFSLGAEVTPLPASIMTEVLTLRGGVSGDIPQWCHSALGLPCFAEFRRSKLSLAEGFEVQQTLFISRASESSRKQVTAHGWRRDWPEDKVKGCNNLHPELGAVQQLPCCAWSPGEPLWANLTDFLPTPLREKLGVLLNTWVLP